MRTSRCCLPLVAAVLIGAASAPVAVAEQHISNTEPSWSDSTSHGVPGVAAQPSFHYNITLTPKPSPSSSDAGYQVSMMLDQLKVPQGQWIAAACTKQVKSGRALSRKGGRCRRTVINQRSGKQPHSAGPKVIKVPPFFINLKAGTHLATWWSVYQAHPYRQRATSWSFTELNASQWLELRPPVTP